MADAPNAPIVPIRRALVSVWDKSTLAPLLPVFQRLEVQLISTGGTAQYLQENGLAVTKVEDLTGFPSILGGRVKTLHPAVFGGLLAARDQDAHLQDMATHGLQAIDLLVVDLYPFEEALAENAAEDALVEKIDIGGVALIRAAAKNYRHVAAAADPATFEWLAGRLDEADGQLDLEDRRYLAATAFLRTQAYDHAISNWLVNSLPKEQVAEPEPAQASTTQHPPSWDDQQIELRYGENPHQAGFFHGDLNQVLHQHAGKALSYNNLLDVDAALRLALDLDPSALGAAAAVLKHTNPCGLALGNTIEEALARAWAGDPVSAFGGIVVLNAPCTPAVVEALKGKFYEVLLAPAFHPDALAALQAADNRIALTYTLEGWPEHPVQRSLLNGILTQEADLGVAETEDWTLAAGQPANEATLADLALANLAAKHLKSNAIALAKDGQLIGSGMGQPSRIDALEQAVARARKHGHQPQGAALASDAFFPFQDGVQLAHQAGVAAVVQPGGSKRDEETVAYCQANGITLYLTGRRSFRH